MDTIPLEKEFTDAIEDLVYFLREKNYSKVIKLPYSKGGIFSVVNDFSFFILKKDTLFKSSFLYGLRRRIFNNKDLVTLHDFFARNTKITYSIISSILGPEKVRKLVELNILSEEKFKKEGRSLRSNVRIILFFGDYLISDPFDRRIPDFVWIGSDSIMLAGKLKLLNSKGKWAVDIGSGSGIQAIAFSNGSNTKVIAIDINEKGLRYGRLNAIINKKTNIHFIRSDMLSAIKGGIDIIISNPPFVFLPSAEKTINRDGYGGELGLEKIIYILKSVPEYLNSGGKSMILTLSPVISGKDILIEEVKKLFDKNYSINYEILDYVYINNQNNIYDSKNIAYFIQGILEISKNEKLPDVRISIKDIPRIRKLLSFIKIFFKKELYKNYAHAVQ